MVLCLLLVLSCVAYSCGVVSDIVKSSLRGYMTASATAIADVWLSLGAVCVRSPCAGLGCCRKGDGTGPMVVAAPISGWGWSGAVNDGWLWNIARYTMSDFVHDESWISWYRDVVRERPVLGGVPHDDLPQCTMVVPLQKLGHCAIGCGLDVVVHNEAGIVLRRPNVVQNCSSGSSANVHFSPEMVWCIVEISSVPMDKAFQTGAIAGWLCRSGVSMALEFRLGPPPLAMCIAGVVA
eukprot:6469941-Amphidinium_carterae.3